jgi:hypothetical protein
MESSNEKEVWKEIKKKQKKKGKKEISNFNSKFVFFS